MSCRTNSWSSPQQCPHIDVSPTTVIPENTGNYLAIAMWLGSQCIKCFFTWTLPFFRRLADTPIHYTWWRKKKNNCHPSFFIRLLILFGLIQFHTVCHQVFFTTQELFTWSRVSFVVEKENVDSMMDCRCNQIRCAWKPFPFGVKPCHL